MENIPPLFIGGAGRSGTTLLVDMMGLHPDISPVYETDFVVSLVKLFYSNNNLSFEQKKQQYKKVVYEWSETLPYRPHNKREHEKYVHGPHYICFEKEFIRKLTDAYLEKLTQKNIDSLSKEYISKLFFRSAKNDNKKYWVNKTPIYILFPKILLRWFPNMKFIHIIRDGRDAALSAMTRPWGPANWDKAANWWYQKVNSGLRFGEEYPNNYIEVKFEDIIRNPYNTLYELIEKCEIYFDEVLINNILSNINSLDSSMLSKWKYYTPQSDIVHFTKKVDDLLKYFGYI